MWQTCLTDSSADSTLSTTERKWSTSSFFPWTWTTLSYAQMTDFKHLSHHCVFVAQVDKKMIVATLCSIVIRIGYRSFNSIQQISADSADERRRDHLLVRVGASVAADPHYVKLSHVLLFSASVGLRQVGVNVHTNLTQSSQGRNQTPIPCTAKGAIEYFDCKIWLTCTI